MKRALGILILILVLVLIAPGGGARADDSPLTVSATVDQPVLLPGVNHNVTVTVEGSRASDAKEIRARRLSGTVSITPEKAAVSNGKATFVLASDTPGEFILQFDALDANGAVLKKESGKPDLLPEATVFLARSIATGFEGGFMSRRVASDLFMGATFANEYDANGKNGGFGDASALVRLTFDTIWHPGITEGTASNPGSPSPPQIGSRRALNGGAGMVHTGMEMQFSDLPFGVVTGIASGQSTKRDNAFTGGLYLFYQPDRPGFWASYSPTSDRPKRPYDAVRWGVISRAGFTTRLEETSNHDHDISRFSVGLRLTHHQTAAPTAVDEWENVLPMRFVEVNLTRFEEWGGSHSQTRVIIDGGIRLPGAGSDMIPFYAGIHANVGRGPDDLRIFAGFLFQIDEIVRQFQMIEKK